MFWFPRSALETIAEGEEPTETHFPMGNKSSLEERFGRFGLGTSKSAPEAWNLSQFQWAKTDFLLLDSVQLSQLSSPLAPLHPSTAQ